MKHEQLLNDLFRFVKLLPENTLHECISNINYLNRRDRRKYEKIKPFDSQIESILHNMPYRVDLIENLYASDDYAKNINGNLTYDEIISSIKATNCKSMILYTLHRCCDDTFDKLHFSDFIHSDPFQNTIKNEWNKSASNETKKTISTSKEFYKEDYSMTYYLGYIENKSTYFNFVPKYIYNEATKSITEIPYETLKEDFPKYGSFNLGFRNFRDSAHEFLQSLNYFKFDDVDDPNFGTNIYAVHLDKNELEESGDEKTCKKLDLQGLLEKGENLNDRIKPVCDIDIYKIVTPKDSITEDSFSGTIFIDESEYSADEDVLLLYDNSLFGPYTLQERPIDGEKYVRPDSGVQKYVLKCFFEDDFDSYNLTFKKRSYVNDSVHISVAVIKDFAKNRDVISDSVLLTKLTESIDFKLLSDNPEEFERLYSTSPFLCDVPEEIRSSRIDRIYSILQNTDDYNEAQKKALDLLADKIDDELLDNRIKNSDQYIELQKAVTALQKEKEELQLENETLIEKNKKLEQVSNSDDQVNNEKLDQLENENEDLKKKNEDLKKELSLTENYNSLLDKYSKLQNEYEEKKTLYDERVIEVDNKNKELEDIKSKVKNFITDELNKADATKMLHTAFDPYISNAMVEAASKCSNDIESNRYKTIAEENLEAECPQIAKNDLIDSLVEGVQKFRNYSKNEIINMYICLSQNFLTVFSGEPGTGKTSICNILANSLGLNGFGTSNGISKNRYVPISVERGWSSKKDLVGYFNPLTKKYDRSNSKIYDGLMILNEERQNSRFPYLILLDEANLSPIEYYWADFMRAADGTENDVFINIGLDEDIYIPKTLHFLATINNDQTTEQLSPRLIDRAWIIKLPKTSIVEATLSADDYFKIIVSWSDIENAFVFSESKEMSLKNLAEQIYKLFDEHHLTVSPRVQLSIKKYVCVAQDIMEDEVGVSKKAKALDFAIVQKLLPKINGYYKDYERLFNSLTQICDENNLKMTKEALLSMEELQHQRMGYCQYLV